MEPFSIFAIGCAIYGLFKTA